MQPLQAHLRRVQHLHDDDLRRGWGSVELPGALATNCAHVLNRGGLGVQSPLDEELENPFRMR